ncbi:hypothetical protein J2X12_004323 [Pseudarthrobacter oxydans]|uniref:C1q domain-containing protein n=1 Tax=Pseudarthrobacter oxydans TaxID=1671 RepID=A0AAW8NH87_PSEOX|nr:hypothetical protein [Pseudarthrobacter oxydans]MDR6794745.1 hypothetical protein [Pseudarthrobacter oxydans]MDR7166269.1 hypothetical protein [Pseudarthrobacter oxydans]
MYDNFKLYNYSKALVSPDGYGRHESNFLSGDIINGFETVIGTGLQVTTKPGNAVLRYGSGGTASAYLVSLTADFTTTLSTADASNPRIDAIVLYVDTSVSLPSGTPTAANLDGLGVAKLIKVNGTPAASPSAPNTAAIQTAIGSTSYPYTILANWRVNAGVSALSQTNCTDTRVFAAPKNERSFGQGSFIESGGVASFTASTLNGSITAGTAWISFNGVLVPQAFNSLSLTMAASKDRYYYVTLGNSTIQAATDVSNGAASPALPANSVWLAKYVSGASAITSVLKDGLSSLGAPIYPRQFSTHALYNPSKFRVYRNAALSLPGGAPPVNTKITFDTKSFDTGSNFDASTNFRFTAPVAGFYSFDARLLILGSAENGKLILYKNGTAHSVGNNNAASNFFGLAVSDTLQLAAGDYVEVFYSNGINSTTAIEVGSSNCYFTGFLVSGM